MKIYIRRYFLGWTAAFRVAYIARTKKRGAGPMQWRYVFRLMACERSIVDGQFRRPPRFPRWMKKNL